MKSKRQLISAVVVLLMLCASTLIGIVEYLRHNTAEATFWIVLAVLFKTYDLGNDLGRQQ
jgi:hypothetical protein